MPPALSDDEMESDGPDEIPAKAKLAATPPPEDEDEEEEEDEEEYRVEKILKHDFTEDGAVIYHIKWLGYEKVADRTWEPIENLENAQDLLEQYHNKIGGAPVDPRLSKKKGPKAGSKRSSAAARLDTPDTASKKSKRKSDTNTTTNGISKAKNLPEGSWETHVARVQSILEESAAEGKKNKGPVLLALIEWKDGTKTQHSLSSARTKCPQKLLDYYEQHLVFKSVNQMEAEADEAGGATKTEEDEEA